MNRQYWLMKTEPDVFSIDDLEKKGKAPWDGVRNYQARNFMRDKMKVGDKILFYHSSTDIPGIAGVARICREAYPDFTAWDPKSDFFDPKSSAQKPSWVMVDVQFVKKFSQVVSLSELRKHEKLQKMILLKKGMRLSVQPVLEDEFQFILTLGETGRPPA